MDSLETLDFSSFIIFSDDPWSLLVSFRQLFKFPLVVQCCNVICEWPLINLIWIGFFVYIWYSYGIHLDVHISFFVINNKCYKKLPDLIKLSPLVVSLNSLSDMWSIYWDYLKIWPNLFIQSCQPPPLIFHFKRILTWQVFYPTSETFLRLPSSASI